MNKSYLKRLIFRLFALVMAFGIVYSVQKPALASVSDFRVSPGAVRPQQGWYVRGTMTSSVSGTQREYFIIDNKMTSSPWYVEMQSFVYRADLPYFEYDSFTGLDAGLYCQFYPITYWQGYSQVDWVIDSDWLFLIDWDGVTYDSCSTFNFCFWDAQNTLTFNSSDLSDTKVGSLSGLSSPLPFLTGPGRIAANRNLVNISAYGSSYQGNSGQLTQLCDFYNYGAANPFVVSPSTMTTTNFNGNWYLGGVSINDLCFCVFPGDIIDSSSGYSVARLYSRVSLSFAIPVDKAPVGTQVGDSWPKVQPVPVQIQGAFDDFKAWKDNALAQTPVADAADVTSQIEGYNQQLDAADNWGELETDAWNEVAPILDSFDFVFTILGIAAVVFVLLLFIKKGMA